LTGVSFRGRHEVVRIGGAIHRGSGTTLIAAETTDRTCLAMELEPRYVDVAIRRWQAFTGKSACLLGDGRSFDVIAAERQHAARGPTSINDSPAT
jgi:hypothetical protein